MTDAVPEASTSIAANLLAVKNQIAAAARAAPGGPVPESKLVAVSKTHGAALIEMALAAGHRLFGENRVQEAMAKWPDLKEKYPDVVLHLIGPLQSNKVPEAVALFDVIETVDREKVARKLAAEMEKTKRRPDCYIQVNTGEEPQKAGVHPADADKFINLCRDQIQLPVKGLMCIPPADEDPAPHFALLASIARRNNLDQLSMGMSSDFETAVWFGATHVRVGTAIFGARHKR